MCLILFAHKWHPGYPLVLAANRDEFYDRPSASAAFWDDAPRVLAGRDIRCGGTWLGVTRTGRVAALVNHREMQAIRADAPSRGFLVTNFLKSDITADDYAITLEREGHLYNGFSLIFGDIRQLHHYSNSGTGHTVIPAGIHGQGNHQMDNPWPKTQWGKENLQRILASEPEPSRDKLFALLADRTRAVDSQLPDTGAGIEKERILSSIFVSGPSYGTRSSTLVVVDSEHTLTFIERTYCGSPDNHTDVEHCFTIKSENF
jgi:uncharacterized protein with NRDE domain